jgi:hypothetical protein
MPGTFVAINNVLMAATAQRVMTSFDRRL